MTTWFALSTLENPAPYILSDKPPKYELSTVWAVILETWTIIV